MESLLPSIPYPKSKILLKIVEQNVGLVSLESKTGDLNKIIYVHKQCRYLFGTSSL